MIIKVCGMHDSNNIKDLLNLDIDYMGMIFYEKSPRYVEQPPLYTPTDKVKKVGVFVNEDFQTIMEKSEVFNLDIIQLHGNETPELCKKIKAAGLGVFKAFGVDDNFDFQITHPYSECTSLFVFDTKTKDYGGSGKKYNWKKLHEYNGKTPFLLSGGISVDDANQIKSFEHPQFAGVDLNSGFEISPGIKDIEKIRLFIEQVR